AKGVIQPDRHVRGERGPARLHVARPNPAAVTLDARETVAVQTPGALVGALLQRAFIVATMPGQPRLDGQLVAIVGPPAVHAEREYGTMPRPVIADVQRRVEILWPSRRSRLGPPLDGREIWASRKQIGIGGRERRTNRRA